ncbi:MAG: hypothetical protein WC675_02575 [Patescibacteria group bacterium]|jgi:hypothetical protein
MYEVKKIDLTGFIRFSALLGAVISLLPFIFGIVFAVLTFSLSGYYGSIFSLIWLLIVPLIGLLVGALFGLIVGFLYNLLAPLVGGVKIDLVFHPEEKQEVK